MGRRNWSSGTVGWPETCVICALGRVARSRRSSSGGPASAISTAVIWFSVSVPVLSELMAEVEPSVSVDRSRFMMALASASSLRAQREDRGDDGGQAGGDGGDRRRRWPR